MKANNGMRSNNGKDNGKIKLRTASIVFHCPQVIDNQERIDAPGQTRTGDLLIRSQTLYPTELRVRGYCYAREDNIGAWVSISGTGAMRRL